MPKILRQLLQNDQDDEQTVVQEETDQTRSAQVDNAADADRLREDEGARSFRQTMVGASETAEGTQSAERMDTDARINGDAAEAQGANSEQQDGRTTEEQVIAAAAAQGQTVGDTMQADSAAVQQGSRGCTHRPA